MNTKVRIVVEGLLTHVHSEKLHKGRTSWFHSAEKRSKKPAHRGRRKERTLGSGPVLC